MRRLDIALATALAVYAAAQVWVLDEVGGPAWISGPCLVVAAAALVWRRERPLASTTVVAGAIALQAATGQAPEGLVVTGPALVSAYSVAAHGQRAWIGLLVLAVAAVAHTAGDPLIRTAQDVGDASFWWLALVAAWVIGLAVRRQGQARELRETAARLERERDEAGARERARMARELHDVVAHGVSVIALQAGAAQESLDGDPDRTRTRLAAIEATARDSAAELRRMLGVLHQDDDRAPQPTLRDLEALVASVRAAGLDVTLERCGGDDLPASVQLAAYRVVQEGLTNAVKHAAPARVSVVVARSAGGLEISVADDGVARRNGSAPGYGLAGLRERVALHGGSLEAGPRAGGGFELAARLPL